MEKFVILILNFLFKNNLKPLISRNDNFVPRLPHLPVERPDPLVTCLPESGRLQRNNLGEGKGGPKVWDLSSSTKRTAYLTLSKRSFFFIVPGLVKTKPPTSNPLTAKAYLPAEYLDVYTMSQRKSRIHHLCSGHFRQLYSYRNALDLDCHLPKCHLWWTTQLERTC